MKRIARSLAGLLVWGCVVAAAPAYADAVTHWNEVAVRAATAGRAGAVGFLDVALVHAAVHDAVQAYEHRFEPYRAKIKHASGSPEAAVAAAAHGVLAGIYPSQKAALDADLVSFLQSNGLEGDAGLAVGEQAAAALLPLYRAVPNPPLPPYVGDGTRPGVWRPTPSEIGNPPSPPPFSPMAVLYLAFTKPYTLKRPSQFRPEPPPHLRSKRYERDYNEVKEYGARFNSARTPEQTEIAYFWNDGVVIAWNGALRGIAGARLERLGDSARLFALANLATADALISCWNAKYHYSYWRPITAIREGDTDRNPDTAPDPTWQPLVNTPPYPDYPSGANSVSGAMTRVLQLFFATDRLEFDITTTATEPVQKTRTFTKLSDAAQEVVDARMYRGIHFRFADEAARRQGQQVANWVFSGFLRPYHRKDK